MDEILFFDYTKKSSLLLIFFFNAIVLSFLLLKKGIQDNRSDNNWLGFFVLLSALYISPFMLGYAGWYGNRPYREFLFFMPLQQLFLIGPVLYFYIQNLLNNDFNLLKRHLIHFIPATLYLIYSLIIFITDKLVLDEFYFYADGRDKDLDFWYQMAGLISMLFYLILSLRDYSRYRKIIVQEVSFADEILFKWINHFLIAFSFILILRLLFFLLNPEWGEFGSKFWYYLCFSIISLYIAFAGYSNTLKRRFSLSGNVSKSFESKLMQHTSEATEVEDNTIDLEAWKAKIQHLIERKHLFTNSDLTLNDVANELNTNRNIISTVINKGFEMNFNDFINLKRVESVIEKIKEGEHINSTLLGLALDSGFNSKSTFNRAFKKHTTLTPNQYIKKNSL